MPMAVRSVSYGVRLRQREHRRRQRVRAVDKLDAHEGGFGAENLRIDFIQRLSPEIVIAVAGGTGEAGVRDPVILKRLHDLSCILLRYGVDFPEAFAQAQLGAFCHFVYFWFDICYLHAFSHYFVFYAGN